MQPGLFTPLSQNTVSVQWVGPFSPAELRSAPYIEGVQGGGDISLTQDVALAFAQSDPGWWRIVG